MMPESSSIIIPIVLRDISGRTAELQGPSNQPHIDVQLPGIGALRFYRTGELDPQLRPIYVQAEPVPPEPASTPES